MGSVCFNSGSTQDFSHFDPDHLCNGRFLTRASTHRGMLPFMQQPAPTQPSPTQSSFAGLLASLASPPPAANEDEALWSSSDPGEDVASLSYERALRAHVRYRPLERDAERVEAPGDASAATSTGARNLAAAEVARKNAVKSAVASLLADSAAELRATSVTIRLSKAESARLRERAAEAGLTISAYLRSCALEAETLRTQVKQALAEMKAGSHSSAAGAHAATMEGGNAERESKRSGEPGSQLAPSRGRDGVRLTRVFGHIGRLCLGIAPGKSA